MKLTELINCLKAMAANERHRLRTPPSFSTLESVTQQNVQALEMAAEIIERTAMEKLLPAPVQTVQVASTPTKGALHRLFAEQSERSFQPCSNGTGGTGAGR